MEPISAADFHELAQVSTPRLSPEGDRVAYVQRTPSDDTEYEATVHVADTTGGEPQRFTLSEGIDSEPRWSPSGDRLAFVSTRGAADDRQQLWVVPTDGGEAAQVTSVVGGVGQIAWAPDGERIAFVQQVTDADREADRDLEVEPEFEPETPDPRVVDRTVYRTAEQYRDGRQSQVYLVTADGTEIQRVTTADRDHASPTWGDDDTLYVARDADVADPDDSLATEIRAYDLDSGDSVLRHETTTFQPALAASGRRVAFSYTDPEQGTMAQTELHLLDETDTVHDLTAALDRTLATDLRPTWDPDGGALYFGTPDEGATALWRVHAADLAATDSPEAEPRPLAVEPERVRRDEWSAIDGFDVGDDRVAYVQSGWDHPGDLFVADADGETATRLTECNGDYLDTHAVQEPEEIRFSADDEGETDAGTCQGWVLTPPEFDPEASYPLAVEVHGGPHAMWTTSGTMWHEFQTLAANGYVVFWSNPRGSAGYGEAHMQAIERDWGAVTASDLLAGVATVAERPSVDEDQLFVTGGSFGGYMTAWLVSQTDQFEAAVSQRGVYDLLSFYGSTDWAYKLVEDDFDTTPWEEPAFLQAQSPTGHAHEVETPTLVLHSEDDYRTPICSAELFHRILRKHGVDTRLVRYPDEGHELSRSGQPGHVVDRIERIVRWFDGYAADRSVPPALEREPDAGLTGSVDEE
ncbi:prolyl oligopeptidase family serine peptidase [Halomicrobium mukohataei]|uniref:Prolyl oligopeptidase family serine peptidase n=1 Tax=Halomicrobium mukohataei TaxID=57705 RepID=A0A847U9C7_9EURY|nr:S9 family peptidase [Halomicrobium mukohataei]NLV09945.1 prolyl oligopeptidase family serine peptidase [Halomicrobium mukohataei]